MILNKKLCSFSGLFMAIIILGGAPAYAAETTTESMTGISAVNNEIGRASCRERV